MNCQTLDDLLVDYLYGELTPAQAAEMAAHLECCPACAALVAEYSRIRTRAAGRPDPEPSRLLIQRIVTTAREESGKARPIWSWKWLQVLVTVCLLVVVGALVSHQLDLGLIREDATLAPSRQAAGPTGEVRPPAESKSAPMNSEPKKVLPPEPPLATSLPSEPKANPNGSALTKGNGNHTSPVSQPLAPPKPQQPSTDVDGINRAPGVTVARPATPAAIPAPSPTRGAASTNTRTEDNKTKSHAKSLPVIDDDLAAREDVAGRKNENVRETEKGRASTKAEAPAPAAASGAGTGRTTRDLEFSEPGSPRVQTNTGSTDETGLDQPPDKSREEATRGGQREEGGKTFQGQERVAVGISPRFEDGIKALSGGEYSRAAQVFQAILRQLPPGHKDRPDVLICLAQAYEGRGEKTQAQAVYRTLAQESPGYKDLARRRIDELAR